MELFNINPVGASYEVILMSNHKEYFYAELIKVAFSLSIFISYSTQHTKQHVI